jgi:hypothetical protein
MVTPSKAASHKLPSSEFMTSFTEIIPMCIIPINGFPLRPRMLSFLIFPPVQNTRPPVREAHCGMGVTTRAACPTRFFFGFQPPHFNMAPSLKTTSDRSSTRRSLKHAAECLVDTSEWAAVCDITVTSNPYQVLAANNNRSRTEEEHAKRITQTIGSRSALPDHHLFNNEPIIVKGSATTVARFWADRSRLQRPARPAYHALDRRSHTAHRRTIRLRNVAEVQESPFNSARN